jgi:hypothetical protein
MSQVMPAEVIDARPLQRRRPGLGPHLHDRLTAEGEHPCGMLADLLSQHRERVWTVPAERMKAGKEHRVPLSDAAMKVLAQMPQGGPDALVFAS